MSEKGLRGRGLRKVESSGGNGAAMAYRATISQAGSSLKAPSIELRPREPWVFSPPPKWVGHWMISSGHRAAAFASRYRSRRPSFSHLRGQLARKRKGRWHCLEF
ncbi:hypothetical protein KM043_002592 [Ampulex compressa]|nr:hypothetical protein KM043_002592 [Ampulex compressa]